MTLWAKKKYDQFCYLTKVPDYWLKISWHCPFKQAVVQGVDQRVRGGQHLQAGEVPGVEEGLYATLVSLQHSRLQSTPGMSIV